MRWLAFLLLGFLGCGAFAQPGRACRKHEDCSGLERGYCSRVEICTRECSETDTCPENSTCSQLPHGLPHPILRRPARGSICLPTCDQDKDCLKGFVCSQNVCQSASPLDPPAM